MSAAPDDALRDGLAAVAETERWTDRAGEEAPPAPLPGATPVFPRSDSDDPDLDPSLSG